MLGPIGITGAACFFAAPTNGQDIWHHGEIAQTVERGPFVQGDGDATLAGQQSRRHQRRARHNAVAPPFDRQLQMHNAVPTQFLGNGADEGGRPFRLDRSDRYKAWAQRIDGADEPVGIVHHRACDGPRRAEDNDRWGGRGGLHAPAGVREMRHFPSHNFPKLMFRQNYGRRLNAS